jgi:hypothetical protein
VQAERIGVLRDAAAQRARGSFDDRLGGGEIGLADSHVDDVAPFALQQGRFLRQFHHVERLDGVNARSKPHQWFGHGVHTVSQYSKCNFRYPAGVAR